MFLRALKVWCNTNLQPTGTGSNNYIIGIQTRTNYRPAVAYQVQKIFGCMMKLFEIRHKGKRNWTMLTQQQRDKKRDGLRKWSAAAFDSNLEEKSPLSTFAPYAMEQFCPVPNAGISNEQMRILWAVVNSGKSKGVTETAWRDGEAWRWLSRLNRGSYSASLPLTAYIWCFIYCGTTEIPVLLLLLEEQ